MGVLVKFNVPMTKNGVKREVGETMELDATQAVLLAKRGAVEVPGFEVKQETRQVTVDVLVPTEDN